MATLLISLVIFSYIGFLIYRRVTHKSSSCSCSTVDCPIKNQGHEEK
ncbi:hypothetical protein DOK76_02995 [Vagococcus sp. DIV0080]|uniref:FeoB-associated Cys-rich membrane protein n=1 Tax=Candidatus Vagococcus giribetii TaxID=2230876 RepID=A0ABS3HQX1_9ENTE|nr:hypothetical protein [Vagococcus sp. DIV0080]MBO0476021.1 hypothetical protein [Vagococcus sp. DIV0080]